MSSAFGDDDDRPIKRSPPWVRDSQQQDRTRHLAEEVAEVARQLERQALRSQLTRSEQWDDDQNYDDRDYADQEEAPRADEPRYLTDPNRGAWSPNLEPVIMPPPPRDERRMPGFKMAFGLAGAVGVAAGAAFVLMHAVQTQTTGVALSGDRGSGNAESFATLAQITSAEAKVPSAEPSPARVGALLANTQANIVAITPPPLPEPQSPRGIAPSTYEASPAPAPVPPAPAVAVPETRTVDPLSADEVASLRKRGQDLISVGDIASARLILTRLAEAGDAQAAFLLGGTFDASVLASLHVVGIRPDPAKARAWYSKAAEQGSVEARRRLQQSSLR